MKTKTKAVPKKWPIHKFTKAQKHLIEQAAKAATVSVRVARKALEPPPEADIPAEESQSDINARVNNALVDFERQIKQLQAIVVELQKLPTAIAPQTQSQISTLQEITGKLGELNALGLPTLSK